MEAPVIVQTNRERLSLTHDKAVSYGKYKSTVAVRWLTKRKQWAQKPAPQYEQQAVMSDPCFFEYFVPGARCYFNANMSKKLRLVNALEARYHSLVMESQEETDWLQHEITNAEAGDIITLPFLGGQPVLPAAVTVIVEVPSADKKVLRRFRRLFERYDDGSGSHDDAIVKFLVPVSRQIGREFVRCTVRSGPGYKAGRVKVRPRFPLEPGFAITVNKAQGQTLDKVIVALSERPHSASVQFSYSGLYVALSRVRRRSDIRLLLVGDSVEKQMSTLAYLKDLKPDPYQLSMIHGFREGVVVDDGVTDVSARRIWNKKAAHSKLVELDNCLHNGRH